MANKCKYYKLIKQVSYNNGQTWSNVNPPQYQQGDLYELHSADCPSGDTPTPTGDTGCTTEYRWVSGGENCVLTDKWIYDIKQVSYDCGETWNNTDERGNARCIEVDATECGWVTPNMDGVKWYRVDSIFGNKTTYCDDVGSIMPTALSATSAACDSGNAITTSITQDYGSNSEIHTFVIGNCVGIIDVDAFAYMSGGECGSADYGQPKIHIIIPSSVRWIGVGAFQHANIGELEWEANTEGIGLGISAFEKTKIDYINALPTTFTFVCDDSFNDASFGNIDTITFDKQVGLDIRAFAGCPFKTMIFNNGFTYDSSWKGYCFKYMHNMETIILNGSRSNYPSDYLNEIINNAPYVVIQDNTVTTGDTKFSARYVGGNYYSVECDGDSTLSSGNTKSSEYEYSAMTSAVIGDCVATIGYGAFIGCTSLTAINIPNNIRIIDTFAFEYCSGLTSVTVGNGVTSIGDSAFAYCKSLTAITIPSSVTNIDFQAFNNCTSLTSITIEAINPPTIGSYPFWETNDCPIYVPSESVNTYKSASGWSTYANRIQAIS